MWLRIVRSAIRTNQPGRLKDVAVQGDVRAESQVEEREAKDHTLRGNQFPPIQKKCGQQQCDDKKPLDLYFGLINYSIVYVHTGIHGSPPQWSRSIKYPTYPRP